MSNNKKTQIIIDSTTDVAGDFSGRVMVVPMIVSFWAHPFSLKRANFFILPV
jgi:hypothetical protein